MECASALIREATQLGLTYRHTQLLPWCWAAGAGVAALSCVTCGFIFSKKFSESPWPRDPPREKVPTERSPASLSCVAKAGARSFVTAGSNATYWCCDGWCGGRQTPSLHMVTFYTTGTMAKRSTSPERSSGCAAPSSRTWRPFVHGFHGRQRLYCRRGIVLFFVCGPTSCVR